MKKYFVILAICVLGGFFGTGCSTAAPSKIEERKVEKQNEASEKDFVSVEDAVKTALKAGDKMPDFVLPNAKNESVSSKELLKKSNLVVVFYRGDWCPFCNLYLKKLQENNADIVANGGSLVAISIENPDDSLSVAEKNKLEFTVLSDKNLDLARKFRIVYELPGKMNEKYKSKGIDLVRDNGTERPELPISATYIVKQDGEITYAFLDPDFKKRLEPDEIIGELKKLKGNG